MATTVNKEFWLPLIEENFYSNWGLLTQLAKDDSVYVDNKKIHIPNAGEPNAVLVNNTSYPVTVEGRTDAVHSITMDSYQVPPVRLGHFDTASLSYDKASSIANDFIGQIGEVIMYNAFVKWYVGDDNLVSTTGSVEAVPGIGNRKKIKVEDVKNCALALDLQNAPDSNRTLLLPAQMFYQLNEAIKDNVHIVEQDGLQMFDRSYFGFKVVKMPKVYYAAANGSVVRAVGHTLTAGDTMGGYAYVKDAVTVGKSPVNMYTSESRPEYYGDIMSAESWAGASYRREDKKFVIPIIAAS